MKIRAILLAAIMANGCGDAERLDDRGSVSSSDADIGNDGGLAWLDSGYDAVTEQIQKDEWDLSFESTAAKLSVREATALALCGCAGDWYGSWLSSSNAKRGILHQVLIPEIRNSVASDERLKELLSLPPDIQDIVQQLISVDDEITTAVREQLLERIGLALGDARVNDSATFFLDGFVGLGGNEAGFKSSGGIVNVNEQAAAWLLSLSTGEAGLPESAKLANTDALVGIVKLLSEWTYIFGMDERPDIGRFGGLMFDPYTDVSGRLRHFDPRDDDFVGVFSGTYQVFYPAANSLELATEVREVWQRDGSLPSLEELAMIWSSGARLYDLLKPTNRGALAPAFGDDALLPNNVHELPLLVLLQMERYIDGGFVDTDLRQVFTTIRIDQELSIDRSEVDVSYLNSLLQFADAVVLWLNTLKDADKQELDESNVTQLNEASVSFTQLLKFIGQTLLGIDLKLLQGSNATLAVASRYGLVLSQIERLGFMAPVLKDRVSEVTALIMKSHWTNTLANPSVPVPAEDLLWFSALLGELEGKRFAKTRWVVQLRKFIEEKLESEISFE